MPAVVLERFGGPDGPVSKEVQEPEAGHVLAQREKKPFRLTQLEASEAKFRHLIRVPRFAIGQDLKGEPVMGPTWMPPQPVIMQADLDKYVDDKMPPLHYLLCGCKDLSGYPQAGAESRSSPDRDGGVLPPLRLWPPSSEKRRANS
jgi:hypothetical protein